MTWAIVIIGLIIFIAVKAADSHNKKLAVEKLASDNRLKDAKIFKATLIKSLGRTEI
jgi:hypothetical protein